MSMDINTERHCSRLNFNNIYMSVRDVRDREIGTFNHDVDSLKNNSFAIVTLKNGSEVSLISKVRNYSSTEYEIMVSFLDDNKSIINELSKDDRRQFFSLVSEIEIATRKLSKLQIAVGLNQHPNGHTLPYINEIGQKNRIQTLQPLHAHVYETSISSDKKYRIGDLSKEDQRDICDPLILLSSDVLMSELTKSKRLHDLITNSLITIAEPPLGLNIELPMTIQNFLSENINLLSDIQKIGLETYRKMFSLFAKLENSTPVLLSLNNRVENVKDFLEKYRLSKRSRKLLRMLAIQLSDINTVPIYNTFINGYAATYTIFTNEDGHTVVNIHPRLMSRGNSPDSYCIYVDNSKAEIETTEDRLKKAAFYQKVIKEVSKKFDIRTTNFLYQSDTKVDKL